MTKLAYLSSTALCALALVAGVAPAAADGGTGHDLFGSANFGYDWTMYHPNGMSDYHTRTFIGQGAFGVPLGNGWSAQGNFSFETQQFNNIGPGKFSVDTWQVGGVAGYNFDGQGRLGFDLAYQTVDFGVSLDGYRAGLRGDWYWRPDVTLRAVAGYQDYNTNGIKADGFYGSGGGSYYFNRNFGFRGNVDYYTYRITGFGPPSSDYDVWDFGGKLQYKCDTYPLVFGAHANYATIDAFGSHSNDWVLGLDLTALFGIGAQNSSLRDAEANAPFEPMRIGVKHFTF